MIGNIQRKTLIALLIWLAAVPGFAAAAQGLDQASIEAVLRHPNLQGASVGVEIYSISEGEEVFARNARTPLIVASNNKLVTTASALHHLGTDYRLATRIYALGTIQDSVLDGSLVLRGGGDPCLSERVHGADPLAPLDELARAVAAAGIRRVEGALLLDDTIFDREYVAPGWPQDQLNRHYCAPVSALSCLENLIQVEITPGSRIGAAAAVGLQPGGAPFEPSGRVETTSTPGENVIHIDRPERNGRISVTGRTWVNNNASRFPVPVRNPPLYMGALFLEALKRAGVEGVKGMALAEKAPDYGAEDCRLLGTVEHDLVSAVILTNKNSLNHYAEQLFKLAGWKTAGKGTFASGEVAAGKLFQDLGLEDIDAFRMADGSGLSRGCVFSARTLAVLLAAMYQSPLRDDYIRSLPIAGMDGSLEDRLNEEPYRSRVRAKTGWIREVSALSGYAQSLSGEVFVFSILINGYRGSNGTMKGIQDRICRIIVDG